MATRKRARRATKEAQRTSEPTPGRIGFAIQLYGEIVAEVDGPLAVLTIRLAPTEEQTLHKPNSIEVEVNPETQETVGSVEIPANSFADDEQFHKCLYNTARKFLQMLPAVLHDEAAMHFVDSANFAALGLEVEGGTVEKQDVIKSHLKRTNERLRLMFGLDRRGKHSKWTKPELSRAVQGVMRDIPKSQARDYENVASRLRTIYGNRAPKSGESLRQLVRNLGINWKEMKTVK